MAWSKAKTAGLSIAIILLTIIGFIVVCLLQVKSAREKDFVVYEIQRPTLAQKIFTRAADQATLHNQMVGTWEMRAAKSWGATEFTYLPPGNRRFKIFTLTNWSLVYYDADSTAVYSAGGAYSLKGNLYSESIDKAYGGMARFRGNRPKFNIRVDGNKYYQMGLGKKPFIEEMWERVHDIPAPDPPAQ